MGGKKSHVQLGDFFTTLKKRERSEVGAAGRSKRKTLRRWRKKGEPALAGCLRIYYIVP